MLLQRGIFYYFIVSVVKRDVSVDNESIDNFFSLHWKLQRNLITFITEDYWRTFTVGVYFYKYITLFTVMSTRARYSCIVTSLYKLQQFSRSFYTPAST